MQSDHNQSQNLDPEKGQLLVKLARQTLMEHLGKQVPQGQIDSLNAALKDPCFQISCGTFVTLQIDEQLRGCIGNLTSNESLVSGVRRNAINAGFHDPRFAPLNASELERVKIEISILTEPKPMNYRDDADLIRKLKPGEDGVTIRSTPRSARAGRLTRRKSGYIRRDVPS